MNEIEHFGKGAIPDPKDDRDFEAPLGAVSVDWSKEFRLAEPPPFDQKNADCCVACAWSYFHWQLKNKVFSKRDLFCRIAIDYGAYIRDGGLALVKEGQADNKEVKDPSNPTPQNMRDASGTKPEFRIDDKEYNSFALKQADIDGVAWAIQNYKGVVFGVTGSNAGWLDMKKPRPPMQGESTWGHALYGFGFHMHDGVKCIIAKSSWSRTNEHHIDSTYFYAMNGVFSPWTLIPKSMQNELVKNIIINGTHYVGIASPNIDSARAVSKAFGNEIQVNDKGEITNADFNLKTK